MPGRRSGSAVRYREKTRPQIALDKWYESYYSRTSMKREGTPSILSLAILGLVSREPLSGYSLRKIFATSPMGRFSTSPGAIYPALRRMERMGWIRARVERQDTLRPRQAFTATAEGRRILRRRLSEPVTYEDVAWRFDELMLRFAFMGELVGTECALAFLRELVPRINEYVRYLERHLEIQRKQKHMTGAYALERGLAVHRETGRWAKRVIKDLERRRE